MTPSQSSISNPVMTVSKHYSYPLSLVPWPCCDVLCTNTPLLRSSPLPCVLPSTFPPPVPPPPPPPPGGLTCLSRSMVRARRRAMSPSSRLLSPTTSCQLAPGVWGCGWGGERGEGGREEAATGKHQVLLAMHDVTYQQQPTHDEDWLLDMRVKQVAWICGGSSVQGQADLYRPARPICHSTASLQTHAATSHHPCLPPPPPHLHRCTSPPSPLSPAAHASTSSRLHPPHAACPSPLPLHMQFTLNLPPSPPPSITRRPGLLVPLPLPQQFVEA
jgi:hypothetical protein